MDLKVEEFQGIEDIDVEGVEPITRLPKYIPLHKGKAKVMKDPNAENFVVSMPL